VRTFPNAPFCDDAAELPPAELMERAATTISRSLFVRGLESSPDRLAETLVGERVRSEVGHQRDSPDENA
jgi:hypothetical protein